MFALSEERPEGVVRCAARLHQARIGETVSHRDLRKVIGPGLENQYYNVIRTARMRLNREHGIVFAAVKGVGYQRLGAGEGVVTTGSTGLKRVRSATKRYGEQLKQAFHHANDLSPEERRTASQTLSMLGLVNYLARKQTVAKIPTDDVPRKPDSLAGLRKIFGL